MNVVYDIFVNKAYFLFKSIRCDYIVVNISLILIPRCNYIVAKYSIIRLHGSKVIDMKPCAGRSSQITSPIKTKLRCHNIYGCLFHSLALLVPPER